MLINGKVIASTNMLDIRNPYTGKIAGYAPVASRVEVGHALELASKTRCSLPVADRVAFLEKVALSIADKTEEFALCITDETGLSLKDARHEVKRAIATAEMSAWVTKNIMANQDLALHYQIPLRLREPHSPVLGKHIWRIRRFR